MADFAFPSSGRAPRHSERVSDHDTVDQAAARLVSRLGLRACWYEPFPFAALMPRIEVGRIVLPPSEPGVAPWSFGGGVELPVRFAGLTLGRFVLVPTGRTTGVIISPSARSVAIAWADRAGSVLAAAMLDEATGGPTRTGPR